MFLIESMYTVYTFQFWYNICGSCFSSHCIIIFSNKITVVQWEILDGPLVMDTAIIIIMPFHNLSFVVSQMAAKTV